MPITRQFGISFFITQGQTEHLFLSVTNGFEHGPGIQRDGLTAPRMRDPHSVAAVVGSRGLNGREWRNLPITTDAFVQRAGTWTLYHHLKRFNERYGKKWRIAAVQSNGDLTMNLWHVAYINRADSGHSPQLCGLRTLEDDQKHQEPLGKRTYRCLVKWGEQAAKVLGTTYEFIHIRFEPLADERWMVKVVDRDLDDKYAQKFEKLEGYNARTRDIGLLIDFALSGKPIVEAGSEVTLTNAIDRFEDVRHVFNLPQEVPVRGFYQGHSVTSVNFGEYQLFNNLNERRAALFSPIIVPLNTADGHASAKWEDVRQKLRDRHYHETTEAPTRRGQFRFYQEDAVEMFFPHNVYPFGVLGLRESQGTGSPSEIVGLSSGGLSGRVGNTLEGTAQIMFDFFGCTDAIVLDEGFDVFSIVNQFDDGSPRYSNEELLAKALHFSAKRFEMDCAEAAMKCDAYEFGSDMRKWPLNEPLYAELQRDVAATPATPYNDVMVVPPQRSQMRSVLIFALPQDQH